MLLNGDVVKSKANLFSYVMLLIGVILLAGVAVYAFANVPYIFQVEKDTVPRTISALPRVRKITGQRAIENIQKLHGYDFNLENGTIAIYGNQDVILWVSDPGSEQGAANLIETMKARISDGNSTLHELGSFELLDYTINELEDADQQHYYWQVENFVIWLTVDATIADGALGEVVLYYSEFTP